MLASAKGHVQVVKILLSRGAAVNVQDKVSSQLCFNRKSAFVFTLIFIKFKDGSTALLWGCRSDAFSAITILAAGANANIANKVWH